MLRFRTYRKKITLPTLAGVAFLCLGQLTFAQESTELQKLEASLNKGRDQEAKLQIQSEKLARELNHLRQELIALAHNTQEREALMTSLEQQLVALEQDLLQRREKLTQRRAELSDTLSALSRISHDPSKAFFLYPGTPLDSIRSTMLLQAAVPALRSRADLLREELTALSQVKDDISGKYDQLDQTESELTAERAKLAKKLKQKTDIQKQTDAERQRAQNTVAALVKKAKNLRELMNSLNRPQPKPKEPAQTNSANSEAGVAKVGEKPLGIRTFPASGNITPPAKGKLLQRYGQDAGFGQTSKGLKIETRVSAQIVTPFDGQIVFAGPFRNHGLILIIEHVGGYHSVLAGFDSVNVVVGQWLLTGEPIGVMAAATAGKKPELYVELRRKGQPVNPLKWIQADSIKVQG